ncbi:hypothetical protein GGQ92_002287 [Gracilibacillus halotolerans]|uniref:Uncharacterized protein n=1 Tax=Gracilibacillus halotolerans TaxID=74386 RepID=A0A841RQJ8_9BACI|nr:hypothetical protein [Gracilibacillus halotolerans]MBB6513475.1 hypothetical protein [Gracilibacillus halotolerans]
MDLSLWITIGFITGGFAILFSMKKRMESKVAFITANTGDEGNSAKASSVIWWVASTTVWGIVSMFFIVWWFYNHFG